MLKTLVTIAVFLTARGIADAQPSPNDMKAMMAALESAQKTASRPGDAAMNCEVLEQELVTTVNGPAIQAFVEKNGAAAQKDYEALKKGQASMTGQMAASIAASLLPGADFAQLAAAQAQAPLQAAQAAQRVESRATQFSELMTILPQLMRGQRVIELAVMKRCAWTAGAGLDRSAPAGRR
jgi:hypothetical protein